MSDDQIEERWDSFVFTSKDGDVSIVKDANNGHLECSSDHTYWCKHIEELVMEGLDAKFIHQKLDEDDTWNVEYINLDLPIFPTDNLWMPMCLVAHRVGTMTMFGVEVHTQFSTDRDFIGFLNEGEGRIILRRMFFNYLIGKPEFTAGVCSSSTHGPGAERLWRADTESDDPKREFVQRFCVWHENRCRACLVNNAADPSADDLIPNDGSAAARPNPW